MKRGAFIFIWLFFSASAFAQVGINTTAPEATLDVVGTDSGILIPRVALTATNVAAPITTPTPSELIYNTATAGTGVYAVTPGYYYWNGSLWIPMSGSRIIYENTTFLDTPLTIGDSQGEGIAGLLYTYSFTLEKPTLVEVKYVFDVNVYRFNNPPASLQLVTDGKPRIYGTLLTHGDFSTGTPVVYENKHYTNTATAGSIYTGAFSLGGSGFIYLPAGAHTFNLYVMGVGGHRTNNPPMGSNAQGYRMIYSNAFDTRFQVIYHN